MLTRHLVSRLLQATLALACVTALPLAASAADGMPDPARVKAVAAMLPEAPQGVGPRVTDRKAWDAVAGLKEAASIIKQAEAEAKHPTPEIPDDLYLEFSRNGNRTNYQREMYKRFRRFSTLVLAECVENQGRFIPALEETIGVLCDQKAWTLPAHDRSLKNFKGQEIDIDLWTVRVSWNLATADWWLGDKLGDKTRKRIRVELERRTFGPFESYLKTGKPQMFWPRTTNNWNAVCLAGTTGAALATIESRERRGLYVAAAEKYIQNFLRGFTPDGYCSEGVGYWNYGFGNYVQLAETLYQATGGKIDWLAEPQVKQISLYGRRMEIAPGIYPAFADCSTRAQPDLRLMAFLSRRLGLGLAETEKRGLLLAAGIDSNLPELGLMGFANSATAVPSTSKEAPQQPPRDWFEDAGILICRPAKEGPKALAVALKGGHNAEHHNHNDVGSFIVALGGGTPLLDPGGEVYTARTFSSKRYESDVLNSFGHPVPRVAGQLQRTGRSAAAKVLERRFLDQEDSLLLDLKPAYDVKGLECLEREFVYRREGRGNLVVIDTVEFNSPQQFGTALITFSKWHREDKDVLIVGEGAQAVRVEIEAEGEVKIAAEEIKEDCHGRHPTRIGIDFAKPVQGGTILLWIEPAE